MMSTQGLFSPQKPHACDHSIDEYIQEPVITPKPHLFSCEAGPFRSPHNTEALPGWWHIQPTVNSAPGYLHTNKRLSGFTRLRYHMALALFTCSRVLSLIMTAPGSL